MKMVESRLNKLKNGELHVSDFEIKNATAFLRELYKRGIKLYLASGSDEADLIIEAKALGYADMFQGRIFGARGDANLDAKKIVLDSVIMEHNLRGHQFATFGDGSVEITETRKRGGSVLELQVTT
jgi:phosphoglycolate phosphatase-like HAD superfamily hydrolase